MPPRSLTLSGMTRARPLPPRALGLLTLVVAAVIGLAAWQPWHRTPAVEAAAPTSLAEAAAATPLVLADDTKVLVFGDSWTYGSAATVPTDGYAYQLGRMNGWDTTVRGVRGSGYLRPGLDGPDFGTRISMLDPDAAYDLIVVQGSINDRLLVDDTYRPAVDAAWDTLAATFPDAQIVVLGPAPHALPVHRGTIRIDRELASAAAARGWWYISPVAEEWITEENYLAVIDTGEIARNHPSDAGHRYLAERLTDALLERTATTEAGAVTDLAP